MEDLALIPSLPSWDFNLRNGGLKKVITVHCSQCLTQKLFRCFSSLHSFHLYFSEETLGPREVTWLAQSHAAVKWQGT